ncbi:MAG: hypothetical protein K0R69_704 [Clostridia bacterium]|jgi:K+-sensing histidine kinase KdpD|nr:hypothetical protein [Clostridia bacterium]
MEEKVLVCITIQENSRRLISEGSALANGIEAPLHILHIRKGETIFDNPESSSLLENLFDYGCELGGEVHFLCSNNITQTIIDFIKDNHITHLIIGEAPISNGFAGNGFACNEGVYEELLVNLSHVTISVLSREDSKFQEA